MILFKNNGLSKKEEQEISLFIDVTNDPFSDAYITQNNIRLFLRENKDLFFACLKKGDKIAFDDNGFAAVIGYSDKSQRKYLKVLVKDINVTPALVKSLYWNVKSDIFCKVKANNPLKNVLLKCGFYFAGERGREVLLVHNYVERPAPNYTFVKDKDED